MYLYIYAYIISIVYIFIHLYALTSIKCTYTSVRCPTNYSHMVGGSIMIHSPTWSPLNVLSLCWEMSLPHLVTACSLAHLLYLYPRSLPIQPSPYSQYRFDCLYCKLNIKSTRARSLSVLFTLYSYCLAQCTHIIEAH